MQPIWSLGLMSGTSADGIDGAAIYTDGQTVLKFGPTVSMPYDQAFQNRLKSCYGSVEMTPTIQKIADELTQRHNEVIVCLKAQLLPLTASVIGFHGQTIFHQPPLSWQIGNSALLATLTGIPVVGDFRQNDLKNGGQGAPLVPIFHQAVLQHSQQPAVVVNIGGVTNLTYCASPLIGFDTGPGNGLLDDWVYERTGQPYDCDGLLGAQGNVHHSFVEKWLTHPYFSAPYPKSLDRNQFNSLLKEIGSLNAADGAATLTAFTAHTIYNSCCRLPTFPKVIYLCGGGRLNHFLVDYLRRLFPNCSIKKIESLDLDGNMIEAQAFAFLAVRSLYKLPYTFPLTTGVFAPLTGGVLYEPGEKNDD